MNYKHLSVLSAALLTSALLVVGVAMAEDQAGKGGRGGGRNPEERLARMQEHLQLSDDQVAEIRSIRENGGKREDIRAVLNDTQRAQMEEHRAKRRGKHKGGDRPPQEPPQE